MGSPREYRKPSSSDRDSGWIPGVINAKVDWFGGFKNTSPTLIYFPRQRSALAKNCKEVKVLSIRFPSEGWKGGVGARIHLWIQKAQITESRTNEKLRNLTSLKGKFAVASSYQVLAFFRDTTFAKSCRTVRLIL